MFREMKRIKQQLTSLECIELLKKEPRGVLSVHGDDGYPYGLPMDFYFEENRNRIYFHCAVTGHKMDAISRDDKVSFCVYDNGFRKDGDWALTIKSVIIFGKLHILDDTSLRRQKLREIGLKYYPTEEAVDDIITRAGNNVQILELIIEHISGKLVNER